MNSRQQSIEFHRNYCVHYDPCGSVNGCRAGHDIKRVRCVPTPSADGQRCIPWGPCIGGHHLANPLEHCSSWTRPSLESAEKHADNVEAVQAQFIKAAPVINAWRQKLPRGKAEIIDCPVCGGRLHLNQSACNGHVRASCETEDCLNFIE